METFAEFVQTHPVVRRSPVLRGKADRAFDDLFDLYQAISKLTTADVEGASKGRTQRKTLK